MRHCWDVNDNIKLTYSALTRKVTIQIKNSFQFALFKPLSILLGFGGTEPVIKKTTERPYASRLNSRINHLRLLGHCRTADRRRHERPITQKYFRPGKVWRRYCWNVYQHSIRTDPNEILRGCGSAFKERHRRSRAI